MSHLSQGKYVLSHTSLSPHEIKRPKDGADNDLGSEGGQIWVANSGWTGWQCEHSWECLNQTAYLHMSCIVFQCLWRSAFTQSLLASFESSHMPDICFFLKFAVLPLDRIIFFSLFMFEVFSMLWNNHILLSYISWLLRLRFTWNQLQTTSVFYFV